MKVFFKKNPILLLIVFSAIESYFLAILLYQLGTYMALVMLLSIIATVGFVEFFVRRWDVVLWKKLTLIIIIMTTSMFFAWFY